MNKNIKHAKVEWNTLGEVGEFVRGKRFVKTDLIPEGFPCIHYGELYTHYDVWAEETKSFIDKNLASKLRHANPGDVIIVAAGETIEDIGIGTAWLGKTKVVFHDACFKYTSSINPKYVSYFLRTKIFHDQIKKYISSGKISAINAGGLSKAKIPIPSQAIQTKVVRILDELSIRVNELKGEIKTELEARRKQFSYYRDRLFSFEESEIEWKVLSDVAHYSTTRINSKLLDRTNYVGVDNILQNQAGKTESNYVPIEGNLTEYHNNDILIGNIRPYLKKIWHADRVGGTNGDVLVIHPIDGSINPRYLYQVLADSKFFTYNMQHAKGAKMPRGNKAKIMEYRFPVPKNPKEQDRIVFILDKLDELGKSISEELLNEIELRLKQYEYYLDVLFNFPKQSLKS